MTNCYKEIKTNKQDKKFSHLADRHSIKHDEFFDVDGTRIRVRRSGDPTDPTIVFVHGYSTSLESWDELIAHLDESKHHLIQYDLLGHGLTGPDDQKRYSIEHRVETLRALTDKMNIAPFVLVGNSLGGQIAWNFTAAHPDRVRKQILISPAAFSINGVTEKPQPPIPNFEAYIRNPTFVSVSYAYGAMFGDPTKISSKRAYSMLEMMKQPGNAQALIDHIYTFTLPDPRQKLSQVETPTLIMWGEKDIMIPSSHGNRIHEAMPNSQLKTYSNLGHIPHEEEPGIIANELMQFLGGDNK